uniref:Uncharacterized protein n=1 Tax=Arundo donax TaxID=35708 RepID=A0A0A9ETQ7_ARUDO
MIAGRRRWESKRRGKPKRQQQKQRKDWDRPGGRERTQAPSPVCFFQLTAQEQAPNQSSSQQREVAGA